MTANNFDFSRQIFFDRTGRIRILSKASLADWDLIQDLLLIFNEEIRKAEGIESKSFGEIWREAPSVRECGCKIVELLGMQLGWLDEDMLGALLYSYEDTEGIPHKGKIFEWYFPDVIEIAGESVTWKEKYCKTVAGLWKSEGSLEAAVRLSKSVPMDELDAIVAARVELEKEAEDRLKKKPFDIPEEDIEQLMKEFEGPTSTAHNTAVKTQPDLNAKEIADSLSGFASNESAPKICLSNIVDQKWVDVDPNLLGI